MPVCQRTARERMTNMESWLTAGPGEPTMRAATATERTISGCDTNSTAMSSSYALPAEDAPRRRVEQTRAGLEGKLVFASLNLIDKPRILTSSGSPPAAKSLLIALPKKRSAGWSVSSLSVATARKSETFVSQELSTIKIRPTFLRHRLTRPGLPVTTRDRTGPA